MKLGDPVRVKGVLLGAIRRHAVTLALAATVLGASVATGTAQHGVGALHFTASDAVAPITATLLADGPAATAVAVLAILLLVGLAEQTMGAWRTLLAFLVTGSVGALGTSVLVAGGVFGPVAAAGRVLPVLDPIAGAVGAVLAASAFSDQLWRRRVRVLGLAALLVVAAYGGSPAEGGRLVAAVAGLMLGMLLLPEHSGRTRIPLSSNRETRVLLAGATLLLALGPALALVSGAATRAGSSATAGSAAPFALDAADVAPALLALLPLAALMVTSWAMARGRRPGARLAVGILLVGAVCVTVFDVVLPLAGWADRTRFDAAPAATLLSGLLPGLLAVALLAGREVFPVVATTRARILFWTATATALAAGVGLGLATSDLGRGDGGADAAAIVAFVRRFLPHVSPAHAADIDAGAVEALVADWSGPVFWLAVLVAGVNLVVDAPRRAGTRNRDRVRGLLRRGSRGSIGHMALWSGNDYWIASDDRAAVAYRVVNDVALTLGGPIGDPDASDAALTGFATFCERNGWTPAFYSVDASFLDSLDARGWTCTEVGDDAVLFPDRFSLVGGRWKDIRTAINRAERTRVRARWTSWADLSLADRNQVRIISEAWVAGRNLPEMGFTLGGIDELADPDVRLMLAVDESGAVLAVTSWLPTWREGALDGWTLDFMRRRAGSMNGVVEFLIASTVERARAEGVRFVSLSTAPLAGVEASGRDPGLAGQVLGYVSRRLESLYGFRSLLAFKEKFGPVRQPVFIAYPDPLDLPAIGVALTRAYLPSMTVRQLLAVARMILSGGEGPRPAPTVAAAPIAPPQPAPQPAPEPEPCP